MGPKACLMAELFMISKEVKGVKGVKEVKGLIGVKGVKVYMG